MKAMATKYTMLLTIQTYKLQIANTKYFMQQRHLCISTINSVVHSLAYPTARSTSLPLNICNRTLKLHTSKSNQSGVGKYKREPFLIFPSPEKMGHS